MTDGWAPKKNKLVQVKFHYAPKINQIIITILQPCQKVVVLPVIFERFIEVSQSLWDDLLQEDDRKLAGLDDLRHFLIARLE